MLRRITFALLMLACGVAAGLVLVGRMRASEARAQAPAPVAPGAPAITTPGPVAQGAVLTGGVLADFSRIAERAVPAVVNISAQQVVSQRVVDFFGRAGARRGVTNSLGSGVIISANGYILTNNHVVSGEANQSLTLEQLDVRVTLSDNREMDALVIGVDPATDLALLKIDAQNLPTMPWGDSTKLKVAEWVLAIGNPYSLSQTVTLGIVSALNRTNIGVSSYEDFIQTDAAINPGNSGGALVNARGELIGINTVIFSQSGGYQGIGFAVSSNLARRIVSDLQQYKEVRRGAIVGVAFAPLTPQLARRVRSPEVRTGAIVYEIDERAPAYLAGLAPGDIVVAFNGTEITDASMLSRLISDARIGSTATLGVIRASRRIEVRVPIVRPLSRSIAN
jgi:S1-C subfamily serine protease